MIISASRALARRRVAHLLVGTALFAIPIAASAQNQVQGRVVNENGAPLPGAQVTVRELNIQVASNRQGEFVFPSLPSGPITLEISYIGLDSATRTVSVDDSVNAIGDIVLASGETVIVVTGAILDSTARALNQQRTADNITNVISSDAIGRFPDTNIAEALQRVPGIGVERDQGEGNFISLRGAPPSFTSITIDGVSVPSSSPDTRAVDLGTIPSEVVNSLEVSKTLLPYQEADSIAGSVNLVTRSPFDDPRLRVNASGGVSHNEYGGTNDYRASGVVSNVFGNVGALFSASYSQTDRRVDNIESVWNVVERPEGDEILGVPEQEFKDYDTRRERLGLTGALELRPSEVTRFIARGTYSRRIDDEFRNLIGIVYEDGDLQPGATEQTATWNRARFIKEFRHRILRDETLSLSLTGEHDLPGARIDYVGSFSEAEQTYPRRKQLVYRSNIRPNLSYDFRGDPNEPIVSLIESGEHLDPDNYDFRQFTIRSQDTLQNEYALAANVELPSMMFGSPASYRFGARVRVRDIESDEENNRDRRDLAAPDRTLRDLLSSERSQNFDYFLGQKFDSVRVIDYFERQRAASLVPETRRIPQSTTTDYMASEEIYAGYGMARFELPRTDVIVGLRVEHTEFEGAAPNFNEDTETFVLERADNSYTRVFPNATLRYEFTENFIARAALTRAISRPDYRDNVPRISENSDGTARTVFVQQGNPDLRPTLSNNIDAGLEYYFRPAGLVSLNAFYKDLEDYEFPIVQNGTFDGNPAIITTPGNAPSGRIYGLELAYQQQFTFLPGALGNFGLFANYTFTDGRIDLSDEAAGRGGDRTPIPGQSDHVYNIALFYETARFNARVAYTGRSDYLDDINENPQLDTFWEGREQLDFTSSFDLSDRFNIFFEAKNLTDTPGVRYAGERRRVTEFEKFGPTYFLGARVDF